MAGILRESYLEKIRAFYDLPIIKVITGIRRSGKTYILKSIIEELLQKGVSLDHILYYDLEDFDNGYLQNSMDLHLELKSCFKDSAKYYVLIDEIQHLKEFERVLASLMTAAYNVSVFVTSSKSNVLDEKLSDLLIGKTYEFEIHPLTYCEALEFFKQKHPSSQSFTLDTYLKYGGLIASYNFASATEALTYVKHHFESIIARELAHPYSKIDREAFTKVALEIISNTGVAFFQSRILQAFNLKHSDIKITTKMVKTILDKLVQEYLIYPVETFNLNSKYLLKSKTKYYLTDLAQRAIADGKISLDTPFVFENVVCNELKSRGYEVKTCKTKLGDIDFVVFQNHKKCFVQVCHHLLDKETIKREFDAFNPIKDHSPKYVLSLDKIDLSHNGIAHLNIEDFLLHKVDITLT